MELKSKSKKTQTMIFHPSGYRKNLPIFTFDKTILKMVKEYKYLGTIVTNTGNFKANEVNIKKKGLRATYLLMNSLKQNAKPSTTIKLFEKIVEPILMYNCGIAQKKQ